MAKVQISNVIYNYEPITFKGERQLTSIDVDFVFGDCLSSLELSNMYEDNLKEKTTQELEELILSELEGMIMDG